MKNLPKGDVGEFQNADAGKKGSKKKDDEEGNNTNDIKHCTVQVQ